VIYFIWSNFMDNVQPEKNVTIELTVQEVNVVLGALQELPHRVVDGIIKKVLAQAKSQVQTVE
jgi:hypothetical protein